MKNKIIPISKHPLFNPEIGNDIIYLDSGEVSKVEKMIKEKQESASLTIAEVFEHLQEYRRNIQNRSENTLERDRQVFERFFELEFRIRECIRITDDDISAYINKRSQELCIKDILDEIKECPEKLGIVSEFIFCDEKGRRLNKETYSQRLRRMCKRMGYEITNNHAFRMSLNSNVFIPLGLPVTQRAYLLGHSVEVNERKYSHSRTESLVDIKEILDRSIHARSRNMPA